MSSLCNWSTWAGLEFLTAWSWASRGNLMRKQGIFRVALEVRECHFYHFLLAEEVTKVCPVRFKERVIKPTLPWEQCPGHIVRRAQGMAHTVMACLSNSVSHIVQPKFCLNGSLVQPCCFPCLLSSLNPKSTLKFMLLLFWNYL
jgi:hypothetical protein